MLAQKLAKVILGVSVVFYLILLSGSIYALDCDVDADCPAYCERTISPFDQPTLFYNGICNPSTKLCIYDDKFVACCDDADCDDESPAAQACSRDDVASGFPLWSCIGVCIEGFTECCADRKDDGYGGYYCVNGIECCGDGEYCDKCVLK